MWIIAIERGGELQPAFSPRKYGSEAQAQTVAAILAKKSPGDKFMIFKAVGHAVVEPTDVVTMY
jgi:hypothetical protein